VNDLPALLACGEGFDPSLQSIQTLDLGVLDVPDLQEKRFDPGQMIGSGFSGKRCA